MTRPFEGLRVLDTTQVLAGPYCTYQLGLLGADVVRIEAPGDKDFIRHHGPDVALNAEGLGTSFLVQNANKRSVVLDLKHADGKALFRRLAARSDVLVENYRPGTLQRLGLGYEMLAKENPRLIWCAITGFGQTGPWSGRPAYDHLIQGVSGLMSVTGTQASGPVRVGFPITDYLVGMLAGFAVSTALYQRTATGRGQMIDVAMLDAALAMMGPLLGEALIGGRDPGPVGNTAYSGSPFSGVFPTAEGSVVIAANTAEQGRRLLRTLGTTEAEAVVQDRRLDNWLQHPALVETIHPLLHAGLASHSAEEWDAIFAEADLPAGKLRTLADLLQQPHVQQRGLLQEVELPGLDRSVPLPGVGFRLGENDAGVTSPPPRYGEHTDEVLRELGCSAEEIARYRGSGALG